MTDTRDHIDPPDDDTLAAEYVLGVLPAAERTAVERRMAREAGFASLVSTWERRLVPWTDEIAPVQPPHDVWNRINAALPAQRTEKPGLWQSLALWRWMTVATGALAAACLAALIVFVSQPTQAAVDRRHPGQRAIPLRGDHRSRPQQRLGLAGGLRR